MNSSGGPAGPGGASLFWLSAFILGGLLFAAGVMVGRGMAPATTSGPSDPLAQIDTRDRGPAPEKDTPLTFPDSLSGPGPKARPDRPTPVTRPEPIRDSSSKPDPDANPKPAAEPPVKPTARPTDAGVPSLAGSFCLQVASFRQLDQAQELVERLKAVGLPEVRTASGEVEGKGMYYRVRLGRFADREAAERFGRSNDLKGLVIQED